MLRMSPIHNIVVIITIITITSSSSMPLNPHERTKPMRERAAIVHLLAARATPPRTPASAKNLPPPPRPTPPARTPRGRPPPNNHRRRHSTPAIKPWSTATTGRVPCRLWIAIRQLAADRQLAAGQK
jgi:hypothetical protein